VCASITELLPQAGTAVLPPSRLVELPCCYQDPALGFELQAAATRLGISTAELVKVHSGAEYLVYFIGFTPGLPYMTGMPERLTIPRLETPRTKTPAGSVGIGGTQCCVYSVDSPGGFWVLGRTPLRLYDPESPEPGLLRPGDRVSVRAIDRGGYDTIAARGAVRGCSEARRRGRDARRPRGAGRDEADGQARRRGQARSGALRAGELRRGLGWPRRSPGDGLTLDLSARAARRARGTRAPERRPAPPLCGPSATPLARRALRGARVRRRAHNPHRARASGRPLHPGGHRRPPRRRLRDAAPVRPHGRPALRRAGHT